MRINSLKSAAIATVAAATVSLCGFLAFAGNGAHSLADSAAQSITVSTAAASPQATQASNDPWD